jgi:hypothetical protein
MDKHGLLCSRGLHDDSESVASTHMHEHTPCPQVSAVVRLHLPPKQQQEPQPTCSMVRLNEAQKKMSPKGTTLCHSSMAGSGRWSMFSDGTCTHSTTFACICTSVVCLITAKQLQQLRQILQRMRAHAARECSEQRRTLGYPPSFLHHLRLRLSLMYCLLTCDRLDTISSGRARKGLSAGCCGCPSVLPPAVLLLALLLLLVSAAWMLEAGFSSTECVSSKPSLASPGDDDREAAVHQLLLRAGCALPLLLQASLRPVTRQKPHIQEMGRQVGCS